MIIIDKYYGNTVVVIDSLSDANIQEMNEYSNHGRDVEIFTTTKKNNCGCTKQWVNVFEENADRFWTHSHDTVKCEKCNKNEDS